MALTIEVKIPPPSDDVAALHSGIRGYNSRFSEAPDWCTFLVTGRDSNTTLLGALEGELGWRWLHVRNLWVQDRDRGQGIGSALLRKAERFAIERGCVGTYLDTFDFQAPAFYEKHGYRIFGVLDGFPPGAQRYYLQKRLLSDADRRVRDG